MVDLMVEWRVDQWDGSTVARKVASMVEWMAGHLAEPMAVSMVALKVAK